MSVSGFLAEPVTPWALMTSRKNPNLQLWGHHFPLKALSNDQPPKIMPKKEHVSAQQQFWIFSVPTIVLSPSSNLTNMVSYCTVDPPQN